MLDFVSALPDAREGVRRLSQVLSGVVVNTRMSEVRRGTPQSFTGGGSFTGAAGARLLSSDDAQLAQESVDRLAALIALGPSRLASGINIAAVADAAKAGLESLPEDQAEQYLTELYDMLLRCRVPEALGELTVLASSALLGPGGVAAASVGAAAGRGTRGGGGGAAGVSASDEASLHDEAVRRRSMDLRQSLDMYVRDGGPSPARASIEGLLCSQKLGGHAQALLESICQLLLSCLFDPIWRHRDLLAQPRVRELIVALSSSSLLPALASVCIRLRGALARPASLEAASYAWLLGFVAKCFTGLCRCMKAMVEFEACSALWAQLGDAFAAQLAVTRLIERFCAAAAAVHPSYQTWRLPPPPGTPVDPLAGPMPGLDAGLAADAAAPTVRPGETYLELCAAVEVFMEGLFHLTWHFTARAEEAAAAGPPPPLLVRDVLAAMEPEGSGSVADLLAAAAAAAAADGRPGGGALGARLLAAGPGSAAAAAGAWPALVSGPATHCLAADWLAHVVARLDGGEVLSGAAGLAAAAAAAAPLLHRPGPVDSEELPLLLSVCLAVAAAGAPAYVANGGPSSLRSSHGPHSHNPQHPQQQHSQPRGLGRRSMDLLLRGGAGNGSGGGFAVEAGELETAAAVKHADRMLRLAARGLKAMAATQDAELAPYPAIHAAHSCAVAMHSILQGDPAAAARAGPGLTRGCLTAAAGGEGAAAVEAGEGGGGAGDDAAGGGAGLVCGALVSPPPQHTALLLDSFQAALLCYSSFLQPDPDKDPLTLRAVERCHEQVLELCTATGEGLRLGVAAVVYATHAGLLPALEAVLRSAALTCRLETLRVLLTAVLSSAPALQQLAPGRDGYLFLTLRKLVIACINLACPNPLEHPMPVVHPSNPRCSLTLILQQCNHSNGPPSSAATSASYGNTGSSSRLWVPDREVNGMQGSHGGAAAVVTAAVSAAAAAAGVGGRNSQESTTSRNSTSYGGGASLAAGRPLILPLAMDLLDTVSMLARRFIEVHEGQVAAAANIRVDAVGNAIEYGDEYDDDEEYDNGEEYDDGAEQDDEEEGGDATAGAEDSDGNGGAVSWRRRRAAARQQRGSASSAAARRRWSFEREADELRPLAELLPLALCWLAGPVSDLVDALAQEVINDDGSGSLFGDAAAGATADSGGGGAGGSTRSHHPRASTNSRPSSQANAQLPGEADGLRAGGGQELQRQASAPSAAAATAAAAAPPPSAYGKPDMMRRRQSIDMSRASPLAARPLARGGVVDSLGGGGIPADSLPTPPTPPRAVAARLSPSGVRAADRSWAVLSRCADTLHTLFRLLIAVSDLNRRAPHPDWAQLIDAVQPQQLLARAVQVLVHGLQLQRQQAAAGAGAAGGRGGRGPPFPVLLSSLLSASVCAVQYGWLTPESFGIPSADIDPAELAQLQLQPPAAAAAAAAAGAAGGASSGPVQGPLFSRIRRFTVISANAEGRAYQWAMIGDEDEGGEQVGPGGDDGASSDCYGRAAATAEEEDGGGGGTLPQPWGPRKRTVLLLQAAAPGGAWSSLPPPPGPAVIPTRALQVLVSDYGSAADKLLFDLLLRGLSAKRNAGLSRASAAAAAASAPVYDSVGEGADGEPREEAQFFWVPPSRSSRGWLRTCSNPCCMNLSGLHERQLRLAACPRCGDEWYCSRHCQAMHWHTGHKAACRGEGGDGRGK